jgi:hypothetical protein
VLLNRKQEPAVITQADKKAIMSKNGQSGSDQAGGARPHSPDGRFLEELEDFGAE